MKRLLSMLLVAAMLLSVLPATALATSTEMVEYVYLVGMPEEIAPGAAQLPDVQPAEGQVTVTEIRWLQENQDDGVPVTAFEEGKAYLLSVTLEANEGYALSDWINIETENKQYDDYFIEDMVCTVLFRYSMLEDAGEILVQINEPAEGMDISALTATVTGNAILNDIQVYDVNTGEEITEGIFASKKNYQINYTLKPKEGYEFSYRNTTLEVNDGQIGVEWYTGPQHLLFPVYFSTCEVIDTVNLTLSDILPGVKREDVTLDAPESAPYVIETYWFETYNTDEEWDTFQQVYNYELHVDLVPKDGYVFSPDTLAYVNGEEVEFWSYDGYIRGNIRMEFSFSVDEIWLWAIPDDILPGTAELPAPECNGQVEITGVQWVNEAKQPVTAFEDGKVYYLALTVEAEGVRNFVETPNIETDWNHSTTFEKLSDKKAVIYIRYSLEPDVGTMEITVSGAEIGDKLADVEVEIDGNAIFEKAEIFVYVPMGFNSYTTEEPDSDAFEAGKIYLLECDLQPKPGYRFGGDVKIIVDGKENYEWRYNGDSLRVTIPVSTCQELDTVTLTMPEIKTGKAFSDLQVKVPTNAKYTATVQWVDVTDGWQEATGKVQAGHRYEAEIILEAKDGYIIAEDAEATLNGKKIDIGQQSYGRFAVHWMEKSFLTPITKVELPAMPTSIKMGDTLPTPTVSSSKNYTLNAFWGMMNGGDTTKVEADGIYLLVYSASPKSGYEFTEDTKYYIGGKEVWPLESGWRDAQFLQNYNVGISEISKVSFLAQEPEAGKPVPEVTVPEDADYSLSQVTWGQSATNNWRTIQDDVKTLAGGLYTFVYGMLEAQNGKALASKPAFYLNGQTVEPTAMYNFGQYAIVLFSLGKLGEATPLKAPALEVRDEMGQYLAWEPVAEAVGYEIYRATSKTGKYTKVATLDAEDDYWEDASASPAKTYYYKIKAISVDPKMSSGYSSPVAVAYKLGYAEVWISDDEVTGRQVFTWEKVPGAKSYDIYRGTSMDNMKKYANTKKLTYTDTKAAVGVEYCYQVCPIVSSKSAYNNYDGVVFSCVTACGQPQVKISVDAATGKPKLSWSKIASAESYDIYRKLDGESDYTLLTSQTDISFLDESAPIDTLCSYQVQAMHSAQYADSAKSEEVSVASAIARPAMQAIIDADSGLPVFTWEAVEGAVHYAIYRSTKSTKGYTQVGLVEGTTFTDDTASVGKTYYYKMVALGNVGKSAETAYVKLAGKCATPTIQVSVDADSGKPAISWEKVSGAKKYTVYRATSETGKYTKLGTATKLTYIDKKATSGSEYFYKIVANASSSKYNSAYSNVESCLVICARPVVTVKTDAATGKPVLSWQKVTGAKAYRIQRQLPGGEFEILTEVTGTSFLDETAPVDTLCVYRIRAIHENDLLNSMMAEEVSVTSGIAKPVLQSGVNSEGQPRFNWQLVDGAVKYEIYRSTKSTKGYTLIATVEDGNAYADPEAAPGKTYYYKVKAVGAVSSAESAYVKLVGKCAAPQSHVQIDEATGKPMVSWEKVNGAKQYTVYRSTDKFSGFKKLGTTKTLSYIDTKAEAGKTYFYTVVANHKTSKYSSGQSYPMGATAICAQPAVKVAIGASGKPQLTWGKVAGAVRYEIWLEQAGAKELLAETTAALFEDETAYPGETKIYWVYAIDAQGERNGNWFVATATCAAPNLTSHLTDDGKPSGWWDEIEGATTYKVYRSTKSTSGFKLLEEIEAGLGSEFFIDDSAVKGKTYYYKVVAVCADESGKEVESPYSNTIKVKSK